MRVYSLRRLLIIDKRPVQPGSQAERRGVRTRGIQGFVSLSRWGSEIKTGAGKARANTMGRLANGPRGFCGTGARKDQKGTLWGGAV